MDKTGGTVTVKSGRSTRITLQDEFASSDPFARIERAADLAALQVLEEDYLLRTYGIAPPNGRSR